MNEEVRSATALSTVDSTGLSTDTSGRRETASFERFLDEFAAAFVRTSAPEVDGEIERWLKRLVEFFDADRGSIGEFDSNGTFVVAHAWARPGYASSFGVREQDLPWLIARLRRGEMTAFSSLDELPPEAHNERLFGERAQIKAHLSLPLALSGQPLGVLAISCVQRSRSWPPAVLQRFRLVGTVFGNALARKRATQNYLELSRTLEHAGRVAAIGQLGSAFAHEIKQPLGASLTNAQTALRLLDGPHPDLAEVRAALEDIVSDNRRAGDIVHQLRRFLRRQEPSFVAMAVNELCDAVVRFVSPEMRSREIEVQVEAGGDLGQVLADRVQIQQVFVNLLLNAFDAVATRPRGQRHVRLVATAIPSNRIAISVIDSGPGVPETARAALFQPFVTTKPQGLGIGLAIAQTIVIAHGGRLDYADAPEGGAVFTFSLAVAPQ